MVPRRRGAVLPRVDQQKRRERATTRTPEVARREALRRDAAATEAVLGSGCERCAGAMAEEIAGHGGRESGRGAVTNNEAGGLGAPGGLRARGRWGL
jgi:hypothetical protein